MSVRGLSYILSPMNGMCVALLEAMASSFVRRLYEQSKLSNTTNPSIIKGKG
jgi:hypothetical protein